jgi:hypothetical protein
MKDTRPKSKPQKELKKIQRKEKEITILDTVKFNATGIY